MNTSTVIENLAGLINLWGGELIVTDHIPIRFQSPGPSSVGLNWRGKRIYCTFESKYVRVPEILAGIIHEMGHVFASKKPVRQQYEFSFFGWEYLVAKKVNFDRDTWIEENSVYAVSEYDNLLFGDLTIYKKNKLLEERITFGKSIGIINQEEQPVTVR